jgi:hypothetical protein
MLRQAAKKITEYDILSDVDTFRSKAGALWPCLVSTLIPPFTAPQPRTLDTAGILLPSQASRQ